jgi:predicted nuclease of restriction endonuclease-like RecB superfamily
MSAEILDHSDVERTLARKWKRATTEWELEREDDVFDLGDEVMVPDFAIEHPDERRAILEIVGFWTPEYLGSKLAKIRQAETDSFVLYWSTERLIEFAPHSVSANIYQGLCRPV